MVASPTTRPIQVGPEEESVVMSAIVVNRIKLRVPVEELAPVVEREVMPVLRGQPGFERASLVQVGSHEMVVVISWSSVEAAAAGAAILGPGVFNTFIAPHAESQDRVAGPVLVDVQADQDGSTT